MKNNKLITALALTMSLTLVSCSDDEDKNAQQVNTATNNVTQVASQAQSTIMSYIPAETPILMVFIKDPKNPLPQNFKDKMSSLYSSVGDIIKLAIQEKLDKTSDDAKKAEMKAFTDKWLSEEGIEKLGLSMDESEFAFYTIDLFPVIRMNLAKTHAMNEILDELMNKANEEEAGTAIKRGVNGNTVYQFGDKEVQVMVSLKGNSIVASIAPTREVDNLMSKLLGFEKPSKNILQANQYQDTIAKYNYLGSSLYWVNFRDLANYFVNPAQYPTPMLDMMKVQDNMLSADCKTEILEIFDKFPRLVGGSTIFEEHLMDSHMIIEMPNGLGSKLATMTGRIPKNIGDPNMSYGFSFDVAAAKELAVEFVTNIEVGPYKCELLAGMNAQASAIKAKLDQPLPPFVGNFKGINIIIDELELDLSKQNPSEMIKVLKAKVLLAVDNPEALQGMAEMMMPDLQKLGLKVGGEAVNVASLVPMQGSQLPINLDHIFMAMGADTIGVSLGEGTDVTLTQTVSAGSDSHLLNFKITAEIYKNLFSNLGKLTSSAPGETMNQISLQQMMMVDMLWWKSEEASMNFTDRGFELKMDIVY